MKFSKQQIKEFGEELQSGMEVYIHKETNKVIVLPDLNQHFDMDLELWEEDLKEIELNRISYHKIEKMPSREAFQVMENFAEQISNTRLSHRLFQTLNGRKPFRNFKNEVDRHERIRQAWFKFQDNSYEEYVQRCLGRF